MQDTMVWAVANSGRFRGVASINTTVVESLRRQHGTSPVASAALGRAMTGAFLLASRLKGDGRVMIQILGDGPLGEIFVEADSSGCGRGYVRHPTVDLPPEAGKIQVGKAVGTRGTLTVIKDMGLRQPHRGVVPLTSGEIGKDLAYYLTVSEQIPSAVALGVYVEPDLSVSAAGGFMVETLPGATEDEIRLVEGNIADMPVPTELIRGGARPEEILAEVLQGLAPKFIGDQTIRFHCRCSADRVSGALVAMGRRELEELIQREQGVEILCEFCRKPYYFSKEGLEALLEAFD